MVFKSVPYIAAISGFERAANCQAKTINTQDWKETKTTATTTYYY